MFSGFGGGKIGIKKSNPIGAGYNNRNENEDEDDDDDDDLMGKKDLEKLNSFWRVMKEVNKQTSFLWI